MRRTRLILVSACILATVLVGAGCYESLISIVTPEKVVFYEDLIGEYQTGEAGARQRVSIGKGEEKAYTYKQYNAKGDLENTGTLRLVKLGDEHFYEITIDRFRTSEGKLVYGVGRLVIEGEAGRKTLTGYAFRSKEKFFGDPEVTTAEYTYEEGGEKKTSRALSMPPEKLQTYLAAHAKEMSEPGMRLEQPRAAR